MNPADNSTLSLLKSHRSIRKFTDQPISDQQLKTIIEVGQCAATSSFIQACTIIRVSNPETREKLAELAGGQAYVASSATFLMFCADLKRAELCCELNDKEMVEGFTEQFILATVDVALMAQNCAVAAESMGLGICYIGGIRNKPTEVSELLKLPRHVYPVFGFCLGYPDQDPETKPRLPVDIVLKEETWSEDNREQLADYDLLVQNYYRTRTGGTKEMTWTQQVSGLLGKESRPWMRQFLEDQGFSMK